MFEKPLRIKVGDIVYIEDDIIVIKRPLWLVRNRSKFRDDILRIVNPHAMILGLFLSVLPQNLLRNKKIIPHICVRTYSSDWFHKEYLYFELYGDIVYLYEVIQILYDSDFFVTNNRQKKKVMEIMAEEIMS